MSTQFDPDTVRELAYSLWEARGRRDGRADEDWLEAECRVVNSQLAVTPKQISKVVDDTAKESFPASDPPGSHIPDAPPVNAEAKWEAHRRAKDDAKDAKGSPKRASGKSRSPLLDGAALKSASETPKVGSRDAPGG